MRLNSKVFCTVIHADESVVVVEEVVVPCPGTAVVVVVYLSHSHKSTRSIRNLLQDSSEKHPSVGKLVGPRNCIH